MTYMLYLKHIHNIKGGNMGKVKGYLYTQEFESPEDEEIYHQEYCEWLDKSLPGLSDEALEEMFQKNNKDKQGVFNGKVGDVGDTF